jgi:paraquat-inducible protein B
MPDHDPAAQPPKPPQQQGPPPAARQEAAASHAASEHPDSATADDTHPHRAPRAPVSIHSRRRRLFSPVWIIPMVAAVLGLFLVFKYYSAQGPEISVRFDTAEGIVGGKTPILCRSVNIGTVTGVKLTDDLKGVIITAAMSHDATRLLNRDTQIWVVRARYSSAGISGLNTIVSGNYLELQPGVSKEARTDYLGLENPPVTPPGVPGLHVRLISDEAGSLGPGASIVYKGISVGKIETRVFHVDSGEIEFTAFIEGKYGNLIDKKTHFWNNSGIDLKVGPDGVVLHSGTLESILAGGVTFSDPEDKQLASLHVPDGTTFRLFDSYDDATKRQELKASMPFLLLFTGSVRGLSVDAPVEFRGIRVGTVMGLSFKYLPDDDQHRVPVLIKIDPSVFLDVAIDDYNGAQERIARNVEHGLRASLKTGTLLTGQLYVDLDFQKDAPPMKLADVQGYQVIPTTSSGLGEIQEKISTLLDKFNGLALDKTVENLNGTLASVQTTLGSLNKVVDSDETRALPGALKKDLAELQKTLAGYNGKSAFYQDLSGTLQQLNETLRSLKSLTGTLERSPNSIIFGKPGGVAPPKGSGNP